MPGDAITTETTHTGGSTGPFGTLTVTETWATIRTLRNTGDPDPEVAAAFGEVYRSVDTGLPFTPWAESISAADGYERTIIARAEAGIRSAGAFTEPRRLRMDWQTTITTEAWLDQVPTMGGHNRIPEALLAELLDKLGEVVDAHGGSFTMNYATIALTADRRTRE